MLQTFTMDLFTLFPMHNVDIYYYHYTYSSFLVLSHILVTTAIAKNNQDVATSCNFPSIILTTVAEEAFALKH